MSAAFFSYSVTSAPFMDFKLARNAKLAAFHFGIPPGFYFYYYFLGGGGGCFLVCFCYFFVGAITCSVPSTSGALLAAESKAFLFVWKTFRHIF